MNKMGRGFCLGVVALACAVTDIERPAYAQSTGTSEPTFFDSVKAFGKSMADKGIFLSLSYVEDFTSVVSGGQKTGTMPIGHASVGVIFDLQTIAGIPGASLHISGDERWGTSIQGIAGSPIGLLQSDAGPMQPRLAEFYWEQGFDNDRIDITFGRTSPTLDFLFSDISCSFLGVICAQPTSWYFSNANPANPSNEWGGRVNVAVTPEVYARAGVFQHDKNAGGFNYNGLNWNTSQSVGVFIPVEVGYQTGFKTAQYPAKYNVGFYADTSSYFKTPTQRGDRNAVYGQIEQTVWRPDRNTNQSLTVFGGGIVYSGHAPVWGQYYVGLYDRGPFASRPDDTIGLIGSIYINNSNVRPNKSTEKVVELNYGISVIPGVTVKPYTQYVIAPTNGNSVVGSKQPDDAWLLGVQIVVSFAQAAGFPQFIPH